MPIAPEFKPLYGHKWRRSNRFLLLMLCWLVVLCVNLGVNLVGFGTSARALVGAFVGFASTPAATYCGLYILLGPRYARRWWLQFRFVAANWGRPSVIIARGSKRKAHAHPS